MPELPDEVLTELSTSSLGTLRKCPERFRRRYVEREYEPPSGAMTLGSTVGAAETQSDHNWIEEGAPLEVADVQDLFSDEWDLVDASEVDWRMDKPAALKDAGTTIIERYHAQVLDEMSAPPVESERRLRFAVEDPEDGAEVPFVAYLDVETEDGIVIDRKVTGQKWNQKKANHDIQATAYLAARKVEGEPAREFSFHTMVRVKSPYAETWETQRTDARMDHFLVEILEAAKEISFRVEHDVWGYAPEGAWWCSETMCGYWTSCPAGGLLRRRAAKAGRKG